MFEIRHVGATEETPAYYAIYQLDMLWSPISYKTVWDAIEAIRKEFPDEARRLEYVSFIDRTNS